MQPSEKNVPFIDYCFYTKSFTKVPLNFLMHVVIFCYFFSLFLELYKAEVWGDSKKLSG